MQHLKKTLRSLGLCGDALHLAIQSVLGFGLDVTHQAPLWTRPQPNLRFLLLLESGVINFSHPPDNCIAMKNVAKSPHNISFII